jgi:carboxyl-terminal processing protease
MIQNSPRWKRLALFVFPGLLSCLLALGFLLPRDDEFFAIRKNFQIFGSLYEELVGNYVDDIDPELLMRNGIEAMLETLDPYTVFFDEAENADMDIITRGSYGGVGLNVGVRNGQLTVTAPIEGASGYKQGVRAGDILTEIAGRNTEELSLRDVRGLLRGEPGTTVEITVLREGAPDLLHFVLTREEVHLANVAFSGFVDDDTLRGIGYVKLERFAREAGSEVRTDLTSLHQTGTLKGLILDLRDNPGGLLDAAVDISQFFVPNGSVIVSTRGRLAQTERIYRSSSPPILPDVPLAVLVNEFSASASEIVAGAIQDLDRGLVIGTRSFGKGLVQIVKPLPYNTSVKVTTSRYYTPSGRSIQSISYERHDGTSETIPDSLTRTFPTAAGRSVRDGQGIVPDVPVLRPDPSSFEQALERRAAFFFFANRFAARNDQLASGFEVDDEVLNEFSLWLDEEAFTYTTPAEHLIVDLVASLEEAGYGEALSELSDVSETLEEQKNADLERHAATIRERLRTEIVKRYFGEHGQIKMSMLRDPDILAALQILEDPDRYAGLLAPQ